MKTLLLLIGAAVLAAFVVRGIHAAHNDVKKEEKDDSNA